MQNKKRNGHCVSRSVTLYFYELSPRLLCIGIVICFKLFGCDGELLALFAVFVGVFELRTEIRIYKSLALRTDILESHLLGFFIDFDCIERISVGYLYGIYHIVTFYGKSCERNACAHRLGELAGELFKSFLDTFTTLCHGVICAVSLLCCCFVVKKFG